MKLKSFHSWIVVSLSPMGHAATISATVNGTITASATWGSHPAAPPTAGDGNTWHANGKTLLYDGSVFSGNIFVLNAGAVLQPVAAGNDPTFQNFTFDGGTIDYFRNLTSVFSFGTKSVTVTSAGGRVQTNLGTSRDLWFSGGIWTGSGELVFSNSAATVDPNSVDLATFRFNANVNLAGFTGTLTALNRAVLEIDQAITTPSFTLKLQDTARYDNPGDRNIAVRNLIIAGTALPPGAYRKGDGSLTLAQEAYLLTTGTITVVPLSPASVLIDTNGNGIHDFVEIENPGINFNNADLDSDGDGQKDINEFIARTNPADRTSFIACDVRSVTATAVTLGFFAKSGVRYQLQYSPDMLGWVTFEESITGADADATVTKAFNALGVADPRKLFFRMKVLGSAIAEFADNGADSDSDGLSSAAESFTLMFDPNKPDSMRSLTNGGDSAHLRELLRGVNLSESLTDTSYASNISPENAARFLFEAGFGPRDADIAAVQSQSYAGWIDSQLVLPPYSSYAAFMTDIEAQWTAARAADPNADFKDYPFETQAPGFPQSNLSTAFMRGLVHGNDILRQKSVWALLQIIVSSGSGYIPRYGRPCSVYVDIFHNKCFGRYEDLLYAVSVNGHMGDWLSSINNKKANAALGTKPDENYAREVMQLFSIGLYKMNQDGSYQTTAQNALVPTYGFDDVAELAKVFTGLKGTSNGTTPSDTVNWNFTSREMFAQESDHDKTAKSLLGGYLQIPANMTVKNEIRLVCQKLVKHPNCAPFVSTRLIQNLVTSNPTPGYVSRISKVFVDSDGNLGQVIKAILLDPEARGPRFLTDPLHGKLREPMVRFASLVRCFEVGTEVNPDPYSNDNLQFWNGRSFSGQAFFESPSVFNFFESGYQEPGEIQNGGLLSPEFQLLDATTNTSFIEAVRNKLTGYLHTPRYITNAGATPSEPAVQFRMVKETTLVDNPANRDQLMDRLSLLMTGGLADGSARADYREPIFATGTFAANWAAETSVNRVKYAVIKLFSDSSCAVQK